MTRTADGQRPTREADPGRDDAAESLADASPAERTLGAAVAEACAATGADRPQSARALNDLLMAMRGGPHSEVYGNAVLRLLERDALAGLVDDRGLRCRDVAVQTVRKLGPPWSNALRAEDLAVRRDGKGERWFKDSDVLVLITFGVVVLGLALEIPFSSVRVVRVGRSNMVSPAMLLVIVASTAAAAWAWLTFRKR